MTWECSRTTEYSLLHEAREGVDRSGHWEWGKRVGGFQPDEGEGRRHLLMRKRLSRRRVAACLGEGVAQVTGPFVARKAGAAGGNASVPAIGIFARLAAELDNSRFRRPVEGRTILPRRIVLEPAVKQAPGSWRSRKKGDQMLSAARRRAGSGRGGTRCGDCARCDSRWTGRPSRRRPRGNSATRPSSPPRRRPSGRRPCGGPCRR